MRDIEQDMKGEQSRLEERERQLSYDPEHEARLIRARNARLMAMLPPDDVGGIEG